MEMYLSSLPLPLPLAASHSQTCLLVRKSLHLALGVSVTNCLFYFSSPPHHCCLQTPSRQMSLRKNSSQDHFSSLLEAFLQVVLSQRMHVSFQSQDVRLYYLCLLWSTTLSSFPDVSRCLCYPCEDCQMSWPVRVWLVRVSITWKV